MLQGHIRITLSVGTTLFALLAAPIARAQVHGPNPSHSDSSVSYTVHDPITSPDGDMVNTCNGETVVLNGEMVYTYHQETKPNGDVHIVTDSVTNLTGVGQTTGAKYSSKDRIHTDFKLDPSVNINEQAKQNYSETDKLKLVAQGPTPDLTTVHVLHWRITKDGIEIVRDHPTISKCSR